MIWPEQQLSIPQRNDFEFPLELIGYFAAGALGKSQASA
jgi:hypothetical protein